MPLGYGQKSYSQKMTFSYQTTSNFIKLYCTLQLAKLTGFFVHVYFLTSL